MQTMLKRLGYGAILWFIPYVTAIPLLPLMQRDAHFFKTIMIVEGALVGAMLTAIYFRDLLRDRAPRNYFREGVVLALVWIAVNWLLDYVALLPFTKQPIERYFMEIGLRYIAIAAPTVVAGYVLSLHAAGSGGRI